MTRRIGIAGVKGDLATDGFRSGKILYQGQPIGSFVTHGDSQGRTVYASRIYRPIRIEVQGLKRSSMLAAVAKEIAAAMNGGLWVSPPEAGSIQS